MGRKKEEEPAPDVHGRVTVINLKGTLEQRGSLEQISRKRIADDAGPSRWAFEALNVTVALPSSITVAEGTS